MTKLEQYYKLSREKSQLLWQDKDYYLSFLRTAGQLYKYEFHDQLLIHAQNPAATACAEYDFWNDESKMNRYIKRGSKGIALIDQSGAHHRLRYVYDVSQTGRRDERSKDPYLWEVNENNRQTVIDVLGSTAEHLDTAIMEKAHELAEDYADYYSDALTNSNVSDNTFLEELDELNKRTDFSELLENSLAYVLLSRCGYEPDLYFDEYDFAKLYEFNSIGAMSVLGTAVSDITETALRSIERVIKAERSIENERSITQNNNRERNQLHSGRENTDISSRPVSAGRTGTADRQIRSNAAELSSGEPQPDVSGNVPVGNAVSSLDGDRGNSAEAAEHNASRNEEVGRSDGGAESRRPDEVGGIDEQHTAVSGRDNHERADIQQLNSEQAVPNGAAFAVSEDTVLGIINHYDEMNVTKQETLEFFLDHDDNDRRAEFVKAAYGHRAVEFELDGKPVGYKKLSDGLEIWENTAENSVIISWDTVQELTASLIDRHEFIEAPEYIDLEPDIETADVQTEPKQLSLFGDMDELDVPETAMPARTAAAAVTYDMIDDFLRTGSKKNNSLERIVAEFQKNKSVLERADFLRREFGTNGNGLNYVSPDGLQQAKIAVTHNNNGITIGIGDSAKNDSSVSLSWEQAAERIGELLSKGEYCSQEVIDRAYNNEIKELSEKLWYLRGDVEGEYFIPKDFFTGGFEISTQKIAEALRGEKPVQEFIDGMTDLIERIKADSSVLRFHVYDLPAILQSLKDLQLDRTEYAAKDGFSFSPSVFITEDEKDLALCHSAFKTKSDIADYFAQPHTDKEKANFLKDKYGIGGGSVDGGFINYDYKGLVYLKGSFEKGTRATINWNEAVRRITRLIAEGKYITRDEIDRQIAYAKKVVADPENHFEADIEFSERFLRSHGAMPQKTVSITCNWSESNAFEDGKIYSVAEFDRIMAQADEEKHNGWQAGLEKYGSPEAWEAQDKDGYYSHLGYDKTSYTINLPNGDSITERQDIGDGYGGVIDFFRNFNSLKQYVPILEVQRDLDNAVRERDELKSIHEEMEKEREQAANLVEISSDTAVGMIYNAGFEVFTSENEPVTDISFIIANSEQSYRAAANDVEVFAKREEIALKIDDVSSAYEFTPQTYGEPYYLDLMRFARSEYDWDSFNNHRNVYENVMKLLRENSESSVNLLRVYLEEVQNADSGSEFAEMAEEADGLLKDYTKKYIPKEPVEKEKTTADLFAEAGFSEDSQFIIAPEVEAELQSRQIEKYSEITKDMYDLSNPEIFTIPKKGSTAKIEIKATDELLQRLADHGIVPLPNTDNIRILFNTDGENWNKIALPDKWGNMYNNIDIADILTPSELSTAYEVARLVISGEYLEQTENSPLANENEEPHIEDEYQLRVGDKIEFDDGLFEVTEIADSIDDVKYQLRDLNSVYPIFRVVYETELYEKGFSLAEEKPLPEPVRSAPNIANVPEISAEKHDFVITDEKLGVGGAKTKFRDNVAAIRLLNELEAENRLATPEEQEVLSKYVGWGGLPQAFDENNDSWAAEFMELYTLLSPEEYESARASTLNAHYTSPTVINAIYEGLSNMGFKGGNVLEPAMGVGNFFGVMPEEMRSSKLYGVELDEISGRIAKQLYQTAKIQVTGFEKTAYPDNFFDVAIGNVPFGQYKLSEKRYDKLNLPIHDHFFAKSLDKVRAGGVVAFVTSKGTLDKANPQFRRYLAQRAELIGAIRLPNTAFKDNAGTEVTSDIIFLQKRDKMVDIEPDWVHLGATADGVPVNKYFEQHPEMILGEMKQGVEFSLYGNRQRSCRH